MALEALSWSLGQHLVANPLDRFVLVALANCINGIDHAHPDCLSEVSRTTGLKLGKVRAALGRLNEVGAIARDEQGFYFPALIRH